MSITYFQEGVAAGIPYSGTLEPYLYFATYGIFRIEPFFINRDGNSTRLIRGLYIYFFVEVSPFIAGDDIALEGVIFLISSKGGTYLCSKGVIANSGAIEGFRFGGLLSSKGSCIRGVKI